MLSKKYVDELISARKSEIIRHTIGIEYEEKNQDAPWFSHAKANISWHKLQILKAKAELKELNKFKKENK